MLSTESLKIDTLEICKKITDFIRFQVEISGLECAVVSVSGGLDSAVTLALTVKALGPERVRAVTMPERDITPESDITDVMQLAGTLDVTCDTVEITGVTRAMRDILPLYDGSDRISTGNLMARVRMIIVYHYANALRSMVIGSSNKSEWLTGYFTKYGDGAADILPLAGLYKNQVRQLARHLGIPEKIVKKTPTAGLWPGQTDEGELGVTYDNLDLILHRRERGMNEREIASELNLDVSLVRGIFDRVRNSEHKRRPPLILRLSTVNE
ncbi:MAG: NAD+ synthase [Candidatus Bathyarchaeia archaeon]